jgi:ribosomal protein S18 acetylase RimI-like enzyme
MQPRLLIRKASAEDIPLLLSLGRKTFYEAFGDVNTEENMNLFLEQQFQTEVLHREMAEEGAAFFIAFNNETPVAFTKLRTGYEPIEIVGALEIERIYVLKEFQDRKIGAVLIQHNLDYARENGFNLIWLGVWEHNTNAIRFYQRWGFQTFGTHAFTLGREIQTDVLMKRPI